LTGGDSTEVIGQTFLNYTFDDRRSWFWRGTRVRKTVPVLLILLLLGGAAVWLQSDTGKAQLSNWMATQNGAARSPQKPESNAEAPLIAKQNVPPAPAPSSEMSSPETTDSGSSSDFISEAEKLADTPAPIPPQKSAEKPQVPEAKSSPKKVPPPRQSNRQAMAKNPDTQRTLLEGRIHRAIENRAIMGVTVSMIGDITYLDGRVATVRQRNAAEQAARSVPGVERVRNRIAVAVS
jgi:hypothetical protein